MNSPVIDMTQVRFAEVQIATDVRLHYAEFGSPNGEPIIFLHGFTDSWFSFSPVLPHLSPKYHVWMLDQRGHGNSSRPSSYAIDDFAADVIAFMDALNLPVVTLIGHSLGSFIAQRTAFNSPERIKRLVLIGSGSKPYTDDLAGFVDVINTLEEPVPDEFARDFQRSSFYGTLPADFLDAVVAESLKLPAFVWQAVVGELVFNGATDHSQIQAPTLILWGEQDLTWPRAEQEILVDSLPAGELLIYPETGHSLHWEQPARFADDLEAFFTRTASL